MYAFCKRLGETIDDGLLRQAFLEKSYVVKEKQRQEEVGLDVSTMDMKDNELMAVEGMQVLQSTLESLLRYEYPQFPQAGIE